MSFYYLLAYIFVNISIVLILWNFNLFYLLRKMLLGSFILSLLFAGDVLLLHSYLNINTGFMYLLMYYWIGFILIHHYGPLQYIDIIKEHFKVLLLLCISTVPLVYMLTSDDVGIRVAWGISRFVDDIILDRINFIMLLGLIFYIGQLVFAHSYRYIPEQGFFREYLIRLPLLMTLQSICFYTIHLIVMNNAFDLQVILSSFSSIIISGNITRYAILLTTAYPFYLLYNKRINNEYAKSA